MTLVAAVLRLYRLGQWGFWGDELFTLSVKEDGFNFSPLRQSLATMLIRASTNLFGESEWSARLVPALIGILTIPVLYFLVKRAFDSRTAITAAALLAVSPWHLYWSQNARFYTLLLLFYTLALVTFYLGFEEDRPWMLVLALGFLGLAARERLLALFFLPVSVGYLALVPLLRFEIPAGFRRRNLLLFFTPLIVLGAFFAGPYLLNLKGWLSGFGWVNNNPLWLLAGAVYYIGLPTMVVGTFGAIYRLLQKDRAALFFSLGAAIPVAAIVLLSVFHYTANRYMFVALTSWVILAGLAVRDLFEHTRARAALLAAGVLITLLAAPLSEDVLYFQYQNGNRENAKGAYEYIRTHMSPGDVVFAANTDLGDYYTKTRTHGFGNLDLEHVETTDKRFWFVEDMNIPQWYPSEHEWLQENARQVANFDVNANARLFVMRVYVYGGPDS